MSSKTIDTFTVKCGILTIEKLPMSDLTPQFMPFLNKPIRKMPVSLSGAALEDSDFKIVESPTPKSKIDGKTLISKFSFTDNSPIGILLCTRKDHALVEYALAGLDNQLFVSKYQLELPKQEDMKRFIEEQIKEARL
ncbi:MAG: PDDEXK nuclease domain-containing protein [Candidatus Brocadiaceae bacterium]